MSVEGTSTWPENCPTCGAPWRIRSRTMGAQFGQPHRGTCENGHHWYETVPPPERPVRPVDHAQVLQDRIDALEIAVDQLRISAAHRPHLARNLGERTLWCLAWCDCGWCGTTQEAAGSAVSACIRRALAEYRKHAEDETKTDE